MKAKVNHVWSISRILCFVLVGVMNTFLIKPEEIGTWKNYIGYIFLILAISDILILITKIKNEKK